MCILQRLCLLVKWENQKNIAAVAGVPSADGARKNTLPTLTNMLNRGMVYLEKYAQTSVLCKIAP